MATANLLQTSVSGGTQNALSLQGDGVFFPKASTTSRLALTLTTTDKGFIVYDTTDNNIYFWNGAAWESIPGSGDAGANGSVQYNDNGIVSGATNFVWDKVNGRVGIGNNAPLSVLTVSTQVGARLSLRTSDAILGVVGGSGLDSLNDSAAALVPFVCRGSIVVLGTTAGIGLALDASGNFLMGSTATATAGAVFKVTGAVANGKSFEVYGTASAVNPAFYCNGSGLVNGVATGATNAGLIVVNKDSGNARSISAAGTINASGADYAEYMTKSGDFVIAKGDVAGIDANGKLTNVFADAVSFVVKSTDPSYVGNDKWGVDLEGDAVEAARQLVDRIAFAGQVPVNVTGAKAGDYIVPVVNGTGIKGIAVSKPTFEQYQIAVGKVITIDTDGRARIIVKVA